MLPTKEKLHEEVLPIARDLFRSFPELEHRKTIPHLACLFGEDLTKQTYQFDKWLGTASLKLLMRTWALMPSLIPLFEHYSFDDLLTLVERAEQIPQLFPNSRCVYRQRSFTPTLIADRSRSFQRKRLWAPTCKSYRCKA